MEQPFEPGGAKLLGSREKLKKPLEIARAVFFRGPLTVSR
jgi:hypothetical protein